MTPTFLAGRPAKARPLDSGFPRRQVRNHTVALRRAVRLRVSDASTPSGGRPGLTSLGGPHPTRRPTSGLGSATPALVAVELAVADPHPTPRDLARPVFKPNLAQGVGYPTPFRPPPTVRNPCVQAKPGGRARVSRPIRAPSTGRNPCVQARSGPGAPKSFWLRSQTCCLWPFRACVPRGPRVCRQGSGLLDIPRVESPAPPRGLGTSRSPSWDPFPYEYGSGRRYGVICLFQQALSIFQPQDGPEGGLGGVISFCRLYKGVTAEHENDQAAPFGPHLPDRGESLARDLRCT
jgi:hypothetical protein